MRPHVLARLPCLIPEIHPFYKYGAVGENNVYRPYFILKEGQNAYIFSTVMLASFSVASKTRRRTDGNLLGNIRDNGRNV